MDNYPGTNMCPHVKNPFNDCYCFDLTSRTINPAINYCSGNYLACKRYKKELIDRSSFEKEYGSNEAF